MEYKLFSNEIEDLKTFMLTNSWDYHIHRKIKEETIQQMVDDGYYQNGRESYWMIDHDKKIGFICIEDIEDSIVTFDIRLDATYRGQGYGHHALRWLQNYLFGEKDKIRIEGYTRVDNLSMRKCFTKAGFVKEGYLRSAWENADGSVTDGILYSAIQSDWQNNTITAIKLNDFAF
ncbi:GNAT family N-acetyltransferase [Lysinibacillus sp. NPDC097195]|uniref:GNAT family N-acetyltransferase n=1 Tax=Lysinibacillus sp. NPDC097195 TaxID=3364141 RepID=UPI0037F788CE